MRFRIRPLLICWQCVCLGIFMTPLHVAGEVFGEQLQTSVQDGGHAPQQMQHEDGAQTTDWRLMQDGVLFLTANRQGRPKGDTELVSQNWWMGMASRSLGRSTLTFTGMLSGEPLTMGGNGYSEIFQTGEAYQGHAITDRQHPHDFVMQLAAVWRLPLSSGAGFTVAGGPVGEATLGPVAFMHRQSAFENPFAPLGHHTFDATHIVKGIVAGMVDRGPFALEGSVFHGGEPDEHRWGITDIGALDSWATRVWWRPNPSLAVQVSHGFLKNPEALEPGNVRRTTASASWLSQSDAGFTAVTAAYGRNQKDHTASIFDALLVEGTHRMSQHVFYSRVEVVDVETGLLLGGHEGEADGHGAPSTVLAMTVGALRDLPAVKGFELGLGGDVTFHRSPDRLAGLYGSSPVSFKVFLRLRLPVPAMGRMQDMTMMRPMAGHDMTMMRPMDRR